MTDLATLRDGCQRGEMPSYRQYADVLWMVHCQVSHPLVRTDFAEVAYRPDDEYGPRVLDSLAALQEALWPGSRIAVSNRGLFVGKDEYRVSIWVPRDGDPWPPVRGRWCPTLATAWLDAILAGLMEKDDG